MLYKNYWIDNYIEDIILTCLYDENRLDGLLFFKFFLDKYTPRGLGKQAGMEERLLVSVRRFLPFFGREKLCALIVTAFG